MQGFGDDFLASAAFPLDQDCGPGGRNPAHGFKNMGQAPALLKALAACGFRLMPCPEGCVGVVPLHAGAQGHKELLKSGYVLFFEGIWDLGPVDKVDELVLHKEGNAQKGAVGVKGQIDDVVVFGINLLLDPVYVVDDDCLGDVFAADGGIAVGLACDDPVEIFPGAVANRDDNLATIRCAYNVDSLDGGYLLGNVEQVAQHLVYAVLLIDCGAVYVE